MIYTKFEAARDKVAVMLLNYTKQGELTCVRLGSEGDRFELIGNKMTVPFRVLRHGKMAPYGLSADVVGFKLIWLAEESDIFPKLMELLESCQVGKGSMSEVIDNAMLNLPETLAALFVERLPSP